MSVAPKPKKKTTPTRKRSKPATKTAWNIKHGASGRDTKILGNSGVSSPLGPVFNPSRYSGGNPANGLDFLKYVPGHNAPTITLNDNKKQSSVRPKKKRKAKAT